MNNKGQTLVIFIILVPIILLVGALIVDNGIMVYNNLKLKNTTKDIIKSNFEKKSLSDDKIIEIYQKNDIIPNTIKIDRINNIMSISVTYSVESIFGKLLNIKSYEISTNIKGVWENNKIKYK